MCTCGIHSYPYLLIYFPGLFKEFGPLTEVNLPIDKITKQSKGFAFITFVIPENAVQAFTKLDGTTFQGRLLHLIPAKSGKYLHNCTSFLLSKTLFYSKKYIFNQLMKKKLMITTKKMATKITNRKKLTS